MLRSAAQYGRLVRVAASNPLTGATPTTKGDPMPDIQKAIAGRRRRRATEGVRRTVQLSNALMGALDERAAQESLPLAAVVRRAIIDLVDGVQREGRLPDVGLEELEEGVRRGRRGPAIQWPERVSYVLPHEQAERMDELASKHGIPVAMIVRMALVLALAEPVASIRPLRTTEDGFVTAAPPKGASARGRQTVDIFDRLRNRE